MTELGGYDPAAGRRVDQAASRGVPGAGAPTLIPVPSLLRSLLSEHLDPGYAAAAHRRAAGEDRGRRREWIWQALGALSIAGVFAVAVAQVQSVAPVAREARNALAVNVRSAQEETAQAAERRAALAGEVDAERRSRLAGDELGRRLLAELDQADIAAAATPVMGPGLTVTVTEPAVPPDLSDVSKQRVAGSQQVILDRDLQLVVNSLWVSGAEAISVGGVRIGPGVTIRQAGGGILVDNQPIASPYTVLAIGPPHAMQDVFDRSPGLYRLRLLETSYGVGATVSAGDGLTLPAGSVRDVVFADQVGP